MLASLPVIYVQGETHELKNTTLSRQLIANVAVLRLVSVSKVSNSILARLTRRENLFASLLRVRAAAKRSVGFAMFKNSCNSGNLREEI